MIDSLPHFPIFLANAPLSGEQVVYSSAMISSNDGVPCYPIYSYARIDLLLADAPSNDR